MGSRAGYCNPAFSEGSRRRLSWHQRQRAPPPGAVAATRWREDPAWSPDTRRRAQALLSPRTPARTQKIVQRRLSSVETATRSWYQDNVSSRSESTEAATRPCYQGDVTSRKEYLEATSRPWFHGDVTPRKEQVEVTSRPWYQGDVTPRKEHLEVTSRPWYDGDVTPRKELVDMTSRSWYQEDTTPKKESISVVTRPWYQGDMSPRKEPFDVVTKSWYQGDITPRKEGMARRPQQIAPSPSRSLKASWITFPEPHQEAPTVALCLSAVVLVLCGLVSCVAGFCFLAWEGRRYFLDVSLLSGFAAFLLGAAGLRSKAWQWFPNRNYVSGYILLAIFSTLTAAGLVTLLSYKPRPGTPLADMVGGAICGVSGLSLLLAGLGVVASQCCRYPPPDNRVQHCAQGFVI